MPLVRFVILPNGEPNYEYHSRIWQLLVEFIAWSDERNAKQAEYMRIRGSQRWNEEGGVGSFWVGGEYVITCKMYLYDGSNETSSPLSNYEPWWGIMFRDHGEQDCRFRNLVKVFAISNAFEKFLQERGVVFERHDMAAN